MLWLAHGHERKEPQSNVEVDRPPAILGDFCGELDRIGEVATLERAVQL
jgi:hypothetical protein